MRDAPYFVQLHGWPDDDPHFRACGIARGTRRVSTTPSANLELALSPARKPPLTWLQPTLAVSREMSALRCKVQAQTLSSPPPEQSRGNEAS
eukprot:CAMPEP_0180678726 /NCGR_PEP_ID=MMETSP1037_2-20121125/68530_1 /TAXON_ID=632150 /ORGANISM="Azadinium spinosum, Strain 3D9" /LENGTH=91 /DNA_ID=CAMNT_0022708377 /DNA_START=271 /DNA_END=547 /DNA_ORIENTATION=-